MPIKSLWVVLSQVGRSPTINHEWALLLLADARRSAVLRDKIGDTLVRVRRRVGYPGRRLVQFVRLSAVRRQLLLRSLSVLWSYRLRLWTRPFLSVIEASEAGRHETADAGADDVVWAIESASRLTPSATCLVQALAAREVLGRYGISSELCLGVTGGKDFEAHAWLERDGRILIGAVSDNRFTRLPLPGERHDPSQPR